MSAHTPSVKQVVQETPDPVINMADVGSINQNEKRKQGLLSTFLQPRNRSAGMLANIMRQHELGSSNV
jgi:hypothetical protein